MLMTPRAFGPTRRMPVPATVACARAEAPRDDDEAVDLGGGRVGEQVGNLRRRDDDHDEIDGPVDVGERTDARDALEDLRLAVHGHQLAAVAALDDSAQDEGAQAGAGARRPHHGHRLRTQHAGHGPRLGTVLPCRHDGEAGGSRLDVEAHRDDVVLPLLGQDVAGRPEGGQHPAVGRQHLRDEARDAPLAALPQPGARAAPTRGPGPACRHGSGRPPPPARRPARRSVRPR